MKMLLGFLLVMSSAFAQEPTIDQMSIFEEARSQALATLTEANRVNPQNTRFYGVEKLKAFILQNAGNCPDSAGFMVGSRGVFDACPIFYIESKNNQIYWILLRTYVSLSHQQGRSQVFQNARDWTLAVMKDAGIVAE
jgi:hypothetical protein